MDALAAVEPAEKLRPGAVEDGVGPGVRQCLAFAGAGKNTGGGGPGPFPGDHVEWVVADDRAPEAAAHLAGSDIEIDVDLGAHGPHSAIVWTCDLSEEYVAINADYRT